jgi:acyl-CoA synthetase (NDP forming)
VIHAPATFGAISDQVRAIQTAAASAAKPVVAVMLGATDGPLGAGSTIPNFSFPEQAAAVLGRLAAYSAWRRSEAAETSDAAVGHPSSHIDPARAGAIIQGHLDDGSMPPTAIREMLESYGVLMPPTQLVDAGDAIGAAAQVGYPVAIKAIGRRIGRSVEAGIALDLTDDSDIGTAIAQMREHIGDDAARVFVQRMVPPGVDLRIRVRRDDRLGPMVTVGIGGAQADAIGDESSRLAPISPSTAHQLVTDTRAASLLDDESLDLVADVVTRVAQLASDHLGIVALDLNPVIVSEAACWVVDAQIELGEPVRADAAIRRLE